MKKNLFLLSLLFGVYSFAQVGIGTDTPNANSILEISSADKGIIIPRVDLNVNLTSTNVQGMIIYNTNASSGALAEGFYFNNGTNWEQIADTSATDVSLYTTNAALTATRTVDMANNTLNFNNDPGGDETNVRLISGFGSGYQAITGEDLTSGMVFSNVSDGLDLYIGNDEASSSIIGSNQTIQMLSGTSSNFGLLGLTASSFSVSFVDNINLNGTTTNINGTLNYTQGTVVDGNVLTTDASGNASWASLPANTNIFNTDGTVTAGEARAVTFGAGSTLNLDANTLFIDGDNNEVGIGTATPFAKLDVEGGVLNLDDGTGDAASETPGNVIVHPNLYSAASTEAAFNTGGLGTGNFLLTTAELTSITNGNVIIGDQAGELIQINTANSNTTLTDNVIIGANAMSTTNSGNPPLLGNENVIIGKYAGGNANIGNGNVIIGESANSGSTLGDDNIFIGKSARSDSDDVTRSIAIGQSAVVTESNQLVIGTTGTGGGSTNNVKIIGLGQIDIGTSGSTSVNLNARDNVVLGYAGSDFSGPNDETTNNVYLDADQSITIGTNHNSGADYTTAINFFAEGITLAGGGSFPDYVFQNQYGAEESLKKEYKLMSLEEVEAFTKENYHLPGIQSAYDMQENGIKLYGLLSGNLEKTEELYLHTIAQEKKIKKQQTELEKVKAENAKLAQEIKELKFMVQQLIKEQKVQD